MPRVTTSKPIVFVMQGITHSFCPADGEFMVHPAILKKFRHCLTEVVAVVEKKVEPEPEGTPDDTPTEGGEEEVPAPKPKRKRRSRKSSGD